MIASKGWVSHLSVLLLSPAPIYGSEGCFECLSTLAFMSTLEFCHFKDVKTCFLPAASGRCIVFILCLPYIAPTLSMNVVRQFLHQYVAKEIHVR